MAVGALIVAGCSGGDDDGAAETTTTAVEASTTAPTSTTTAAPTTAAPTTAAPTTEAPTTEAPTSTAAPSTTRPATTEPPSTEPPSTEPPTTTGPATTAPVTTEPPSTSEPGPALDPSEAEAKIRSVGEWDPDMTTYDPAATLTAVTAVRIGSGSGGAPMQVFFFNSGRYLGPATSEPRIALGISDIGPEAITVSYSHFAPGDAFCCPSNDPYLVTFRWDGSEVVPEGQLPPEGQGL